MYFKRQWRNSRMFHSSGNSAYVGGALAAQDASVNVINTFMFDNNSATSKGSAIWFRAGDIICN